MTNQNLLRLVPSSEEIVDGEKKALEALKGKKFFAVAIEDGKLELSMHMLSEQDVVYCCYQIAHNILSGSMKP